MAERTSARRVLPSREVDDFVRGWVVWTKSSDPDPEPCYVGFGGAATLCDCKKNWARILSQTCFHAFSRAWNPPRIWNDLRTILIGLSCCLCSIAVIGQSRVRECWLHAVKPRYNEPLYNEVPGITNDMLRENAASTRRVCASPLQLQQIIWERTWI